jgi:hypothetical protein
MHRSVKRIKSTKQLSLHFMKAEISETIAFLWCWEYNYSNMEVVDDWWMIDEGKFCDDGACN